MIVCPSPSLQNVYGGRSMTDEEICGLLIASLFAGQHTSSITTSWTGLYMTSSKVLHMGALSVCNVFTYN